MIKEKYYVVVKDYDRTDGPFDTFHAAMAHGESLGESRRVSEGVVFTIEKIYVAYGYQ